MLEYHERNLRVVYDGDSAEVHEDGMISIYGYKTYLSDENSELLGAHWYDAWITTDGKPVRKSKPERLD